MIDELGERGALQLQRRQWQEALATFDELLSLDPQNAQGYQKRARAYQGLGDRERELEDLNRSYSLDGNEVALFNRGVCYLNLGQTARGRADLEQFLKVGRHPEALQSARELLGLPQRAGAGGMQVVAADAVEGDRRRSLLTPMVVAGFVLLFAFAIWWRWTHPERPPMAQPEEPTLTERYYIEVVAYPLVVKVNERSDGSLDYETEYTNYFGPEPSRIQGKLTPAEGQQLLEYFRSQGLVGEFQSPPAGQWPPFIVVRSGVVKSRTYSTVENLTQACLGAPFIRQAVKRSLDIGAANRAQIENR